MLGLDVHSSLLQSHRSHLASFIDISWHIWENEPSARGGRRWGRIGPPRRRSLLRCGSHGAPHPMQLGCGCLTHRPPLCAPDRRLCHDGTLKLLGRLSLLSEEILWAANGLPNPFCSSDHLCLLASFEMEVTALWRSPRGRELLFQKSHLDQRLWKYPMLLET